MKKHFIYLFFFITTAYFGQTKITPAEYKSEYDSLSTLKEKLSVLKMNLTAEVEKLSAENESLDKEVKDCLPAYYRKKYGKEIGNRVAAGRVWAGMTEEMLLDSYGKPDKVNRNKEKWGVFTQYYYGKIIFFFRDGKLIEWEERK